jgi:2-polyprenyl-6-methoxyphenol hydroxylase-like FAD-dependent oxidoreductase
MTSEAAADSGRPEGPHGGRAADDAAVIVVGYGPVGQMLALALAGAGHEVLVIEQHEQLWPFPRAGHLDHEVMRIFQGLGLAEEVSAVCDESTEYVMFDSSGQVLRELPRRWATPSGWPASYHFYQPELEAVLHARAARTPRVSLLRGWQMTSVTDGPDGASVTARHVATGQRRTFRSGYIIGADGANSAVRRDAGRTFTDLGFQADWLVIDVRLAAGVDPGIPSTGQYCDPARPHHAARGHGGYARWEFMLLDSDNREEICRDASIWALLSDWLRPGQAEIIRRTVYTFRSAIASPWRRDRAARGTCPGRGRGPPDAAVPRPGHVLRHARRHHPGVDARPGDPRDKPPEAARQLRERAVRARPADHRRIGQDRPRGLPDRSGRRRRP